MAYCTKCGKQNPDTAKFCTGCGNILVHRATNTLPAPLPQRSFGERINMSKNFVRRHRGFFLLCLSLSIISAGIYYFFLRPQPEKDAKKLALAYCKCAEDSSKNNIVHLKHFSDNFEKNNFKSKSLARTTFTQYYRIVQQKYDTCTQEAKEKYHETLRKYSKRKDKIRFLFIDSYHLRTNSCSSISIPESASLHREIADKIAAISDPDPDILKVKNDLIGYQIPGWRFSYLSDILECSIINKTAGHERLDYLVSLKLNGEHDAQVRIVYLQGVNGWYIHELKAVYITYVNIAPVGEWRTITPLPNCTYTISQAGRYWIRDGNYGQTYKGGGPDGEQFSLTSSNVYITSREENPVKLIFTYRPKENPM